MAGRAAASWSLLVALISHAVPAEGLEAAGGLSDAAAAAVGREPWTLSLNDKVLITTLSDEQLRRKLETLALRLAVTEPSVVVSSRGGWQSSKNLHKSYLPEVDELLSLVEGPASHLLGLPAYSRRTRLQVEQEASGAAPSFVVSEAWINVNGAGAKNVWHNHLPIEMSIQTREVHVSGVYYVAPGNSGPARLQMRDGGKLLDVEPELGKLVLFPSTMEHSVEPHQNITGLAEAPRISVAFNMRPRWFASHLHRAAWEGDMDQLERLQDETKSVHEKEDLRTSLLHEAAEAGRAAAVRYLLSRRANPDGLRSKVGENPLLQALRSRRDPTDTVAALLDARAEVSLAAKAPQPIHVATMRNESHLVELLLSARAHPRARTSSGAEPLHLAAAQGNVVMMRSLLEHRADAKAEDAKGEMAINKAARNGRNQAVHILTELDAARGASGDLAVLLDESGRQEKSTSGVPPCQRLSQEALMV